MTLPLFDNSNYKLTSESEEVTGKTVVRETGKVTAVWHIRVPEAGPDGMPFKIIFAGPNFEQRGSALAQLVGVLGRALDAEDGSRALIEEYDGRVAALRADTSRSGWTALSYSNYGTGGWTAGSGTTADLMIALAGMQNAAAAAGFEGHVSLGMECLLAIEFSRPHPCFSRFRAA